MRALSCHRTELIGVALSAAIVATLIGSAQALDLSGQLQQLFDNSWKPSQEGYQAAQQIFEKLDSAARGDRRLPLSMALVAVKNFKSTDAQKYLERVIPAHSSAIDATALTAWRLKIWLQALKKDDAAAQSSVRELASLLGTDGRVSPATESKETAQWLGGVLGYYSGPAAGQTAGTNMEAWQSDVTKQFTGPLAEALADGKAAALKQYQQLQADQAALRAEMKAKNAAKRADEMKRNEAAQAAAADKLKKLDDKSAKDSPDAKSNKNDATAAQRELQRLQDQGNRLERQLQEELRRPVRNERGIARLRQELTAIQQQIGSASVSGGQPAAIKQGKESEKKRLENLQTSLEAKDKQLASASDDVVSTPLDAKIALLSTYAPIDLDQEKQRILDSYTPK